MKRSVQLDQERADFMEHLYAISGRTNGLYTGLWDEFCRDFVGKMRDEGQLALFIRGEVPVPETK
jgi:hypothetical protein